MTPTRILCAFVLALLPVAWPVAFSGQGRGLSPADLVKPLGESWPTYIFAAAGDTLYAFALYE